jgi:arylsulfatase A-like enzyme
MNHFGGYIFFFAVFLFYELLLKSKTNEAFWNPGLLKTAMMCFLYAVATVTICSTLPKKAANITAVTLLSAMTLIFITQFLCYSERRMFSPVVGAAQVTGLVDIWKIVINALVANIAYIILYLLPTVGYIAVFSRRIEFAKFSRKINAVIAFASHTVMLLLLVPCVIFGTSAYAIGMIGYGDIESSANQVGLMGALHIDILRIFIKPSAVSYSDTFVNLDDIAASLLIPEIPPDPAETTANAQASGHTHKNEHTTESESVTEPEYIPEPVKEYGFNALDIDFSALAEQEANKNIKSLHEYFAAVSPTKQNKYTGMFEGYNLVFLTAEGFSHHAVDADLTPTLYKLVNEGFVFSEFYTAVGVCTSSGEFTASTGLTTEDGVRSYQRTANNYMPLAMGNMLKPLGYKTVAYHNHNFKYYDRHLTHPNMGYEYKGYGNGLDTTKTWPQSDLDMMEKTVDEYIGSQPFHAYYMTVSGHMLYSFSDNFLSGKNKSFVTHLPYCEESLAYLACQIELDRALEYLLARLEEAGIAEKTLIVLVADHYPYGLTIEQIGEIAGHEIEPNFELWKSALIIYSKSMNQPVVVDKPCSSMDIIPTVYNLMGLDFDSRLFSGSDILSDSAPFVLFKNKSFITDIGRYNASAKIFEPNEIYAGLDIDFDEYRSQVSKLVSQKFDIAKRIIDNDYYRYVFD